jgi:hypothetical protein
MQHASSTIKQSLLSLQLWRDSLLVPTLRWRKRAPRTGDIPTTSADRLSQSSSHDDISGPYPNGLSVINDDSKDEEEETVLYLGYGSNLSAETFRGKRGIVPISQINVVVPSLSLTFDLPGIPYTEPCFGNVRYRTEVEAQKTDYHKDHWRKGLVGVVYEVTPSDYAHIIATEGGGSGYQDVLVECFPLSSDSSQDVPLKPTGHSFKAHTLFAPSRLTRPDGSYAQPSPRYLKLITDGAHEHCLPIEYQAFLSQIRTYHITSTKQRLGSFIFLSVWAPLFLFVFSGAAAMFLDKDGRYPKWFARLLNALFGACWGSYDEFFKRTFGDGERTIDDGGKDGVVDGEVRVRDGCEGWDEKEPLIETVERKYGSVVNVEEIV